MTDRQVETLGERIVAAARMAAETHLRLFNGVAELNDQAAKLRMIARRQVASIGGADRTRITDDPTHQQPTIGAREADFRTRAPRAVLAESAD